MEEKKPSILNRALALWRGLNRTLRILIIAVLAILVGVVAYLIIDSSRVEYEVLQTGLSPAEASQATTILGDLGIPYTVSGVENVTISVPAGTRSQVLLQMQGEGYPATDSDLYSFYLDYASGMGATDQDRRMYERFSNEQRITYLIEQMDKIQDAVVSIVPAQTSQFAISSGDQPATASVMLTTTTGDRLTEAEAEAVRSLVVDAVAGLTPENVTIADSNMRLYRLSGGEEGGAGVYAADQISLMQQHQQLIQEQVYNFLNPVFGVGNVTVSATVELDFDKKSTQTVTYSPPGDADNMGIIVSLQQAAERAGVDELAEGVAGFDANGAAPFYPEDLTGDTAPIYSYSQQLNAEVNEVREQIEQAQGKVTDLNVSIMIDAGEELDEELENIRNLVANGLGVAPEYVSIMRTSFRVNEEYQQMLEEQEAAELALEEAQEAERRQLIIIIAVVAGVIVLIALIIVALAARRRRLAREAELAAIEEARRLEEERELLESESLRAQIAAEPDSVSASNLRDIQELAKSNPEMVAQLLRNWLTDDFR